MKEEKAKVGFIITKIKLLSKNKKKRRNKEKYSRK
jgi:hypothetical protein